MKENVCGVLELIREEGIEAINFINRLLSMIFQKKKMRFPILAFSKPFFTNISWLSRIQ